MVDYKTFKKGYLNEWVDQSQAARKAAEELAMKEVKPSLQDKYAYKDINQDLIFILNGHKVEFKAENEKKADGDIYFTWYEAIERFGEPDFKNGWRLPTKEEFGALCKYPHEFKDEQGVFDNRLYLPAAGYRNCSGNLFDVGSDSNYWSSTPNGLNRAWLLYFYSDSDSVGMYSNYQDTALSVRLVREVK